MGFEYQILILLFLRFLRSFNFNWRDSLYQSFDTTFYNISKLYSWCLQMWQSTVSLVWYIIRLKQLQPFIFYSYTVLSKSALLRMASIFAEDWRLTDCLPSKEIRELKTCIIVNRGEWLWNSTKFFVVCYCSVFWPWPCTKHNSCLLRSEKLTNRNVLVT